MKPTDVRIESISHSFEDFLFRTPIKFGGVPVDRCTLLNVFCQVRTADGKTARGFGSMPLGNVWSFPSRLLSYDATLSAMKDLAGRIERIYSGCTESGHPIDITWTLEHAFVPAAGETTRALQLAEPIPRLCALVVASPFDAALHDAFGKVHGRNCYHTYGPEFLSHDLGHYLGSEFQGEQLAQYLSKEPQERMPLYHLIGALDPLDEGDLKQRLNDGWPETLPEWINFNGLTHLKIKLNGDDLGWDVERVVRVDRITADTQKRRGVEAGGRKPSGQPQPEGLRPPASTWRYSLDFNGAAPMSVICWSS